MSAGRPTLSLSRKTPLKSKKSASGASSSASSGGKKKPAGTVTTSASAGATTKPWVDTVNDLNVYKPSKEEIEAKKAQRKSQNKVLAKVSLTDKRSLHQDPERHRLIQQQVMLDYRRQPSQNVEAILARSEQVMGICQGILNGEMITPTYQPLSPATSLPSLLEGPPSPQSPSSSPAQERLAGVVRSSSVSCPAPVQQTNPPYMNSAALNEIAGELLITVRELREELLQEREARERLEREVVQQRELLSELAREVLRLQIHCSQPLAQPGEGRLTQDQLFSQGSQGGPGGACKDQGQGLGQALEGTRIV